MPNDQWLDGNNRLTVWRSEQVDPDDPLALIAVGWQHLDKPDRGLLDYEGAFACFRRAAILGNPEAQYLIAGMYEYGATVPKNLTLAIFWFSQAAEQNHVDAQITLASKYFLGSGVTKDQAKAEYWLRRAAAFGDKAAAANLRILADLRSDSPLEPTYYEEQLMIQLGFKRVEDLVFWLNTPDHPMVALRLRAVYPDDEPELGEDDPLEESD